MTAVQDPPVQRRRLRSELRRAREAAGYTQKDVAEAMDWSLSKVIRIESGSVGISTSDLRSLLQHYDIKDSAKISRLVEMARAGRERRAWWSSYREATSHQFLSFLSYENSASSIQQFEPTLLPGLLQDEEYARAVLRVVGGSASSDRVDDWVELRMRRQVELFDRTDPPDMLFVIDEAALHRWVGGPDVMRRQLLHLKDLAAEKNTVTIEVVPFTAGAHPGMKGPFVILEFAGDEDEDVLFVENSRGDMISRDEQEEIVPARKAMGQLRDLARTVDLEAAIDKALAELS